MNDNNKENQEYEKRLQRRLKILRKEFEEGRISIPNSPELIDSLLAVRYGSNGEVDLNTVNGIVRSLALTSEVIHDREELKKSISLSDIQKTYFQFIERTFGKYYKKMKQNNLTPYDVGISVLRSTSTVEYSSKILPEFLEIIKEFWEMTADAAFIHVEDMYGTLKGIFGGDLFPSHAENLASKCGIYTDTIILPDPFIRCIDLFPRWKPETRVFYFFKHAMSILQYKELALADVENPIIVILPDKGMMEEKERDFLTKLGEDDSLIHASKIFGRDFDTYNSFLEYASSLNSISKVVSAIKDKSRVLFDTSWKMPLEEQIDKAMKDEYGQLAGTNNPGIIIAGQAIGRMTVSNELLLKARRLRGTPIIDAPTSWKYFVWKLEYDAHKAEREKGIKDLHVLRGLENLSNDRMEWLGNVPPKALIEIRKQGALDEIRHIICKEVEELASANPSDFQATTEQVFKNLNVAFDEHKRKIDNLKKKKWKFAGKDIGSWLVVGTLEVTAAAIGSPLYGISAILANQLTDTIKLKDIPHSIRKLIEEGKDLDKSPVGMLFKYRN